MKGAFVHVSQFVEDHFPGTEVQGVQYPVAFHKAVLAKAVTVGQLGITAIALAGDHIFPALGIAPPALYEQYREKKMGVVLISWIVGNMVQNALTATGAFEVYSAGEKLFSKLETGRMPTLDELMAGFERTLRPGA